MRVCHLGPSLILGVAATKMTERSLKDIRGALTEKTVDILAGYRRNFSGSHPPGQLVLPENLKEFSMYILGLIKARPFKGTLDGHAGFSVVKLMNPRIGELTRCD